MPQRSLQLVSLRLLVLLSIGTLSSCAGSGAPRGLNGETLLRAPITGERRLRMEAQLAEARERHRAAPEDEEAIVWLGRRLAYLARYSEALEVYGEGLRRHPDSVRLLRHRGHRYITTRRLEDAVLDLTRAAELARGVPDAIEPDGQPNPDGVPIGTTRGNVLYHLGLAHYLRGDFEAALAAYDERAAETDRNDDNRVSTAYWRYLCLRRLGRDAEAAATVDAIGEDLELYENFGYHRLCLLYAGRLTPSQVAMDGDGIHTRSVANATTAYGIAMHAWFAGDEEAAETDWRAILREPGAIDAFGRIAAEVELARL